MRKRGYTTPPVYGSDSTDITAGFPIRLVGGLLHLIACVVSYDTAAAQMVAMVVVDCSRCYGYLRYPVPIREYIFLAVTIGVFEESTYLLSE